ncbi:CGNR zinc finger domain-containing protein [Micromonospora echinaurantiaca]|uniref:CGNR zinc finger domain-containing protein n=1 Tax=Micromonospora echinaurantiaca TaxID=47857 RepID=UPI0012FE0F11|nr:CGNR zinc finger domain-containing protein [Micromonospora echinaurantiaca]
MNRRISTSPTISPPPLDIVIKIVNEYGDAPRRAAHEEAHDYPDPASLGGAVYGAFQTASTADLVAVANQAHAIFAAPTADRVASELDALIAATGLSPRVVADGVMIREAWTAPHASLLASVTLALLLHFREIPDARRIGVCAGDDCVDVYADASPTRRRRYCSITCQNRARARSYRAARRA